MSSIIKQAKCNSESNRSGVISEALGYAEQRSFVVIITLLIILMVPSAVFFLAGTSSMAAGVAISSTAILIFRVLDLIRLGANRNLYNEVAFALIVVLLLTIHLIICAMFSEVDIVKSSLSLLITSATIVACAVVACLFIFSTDKQIKSAINVAIGFFLISAILAVLGIQPSSVTATSKPVFPFTEPSHYAGAIIPVLAFLGVSSVGWKRWVWISVGFGLGILLENLSMIVGSLVVAACCLSATQMAIFGGIVIIIVPFLDITYFLDRINFDPTATTNLSALVYIQGWEIIGQALNKTAGWGLGFQQLGYTFLNSPTSDLIYRLNGGSDLNLKEGSFVAAKLLSELGIFGFLLIIAHTYVAGLSYLKLRRFASEKISMPSAEVLAYCSVYTYIIEMFVRGAGYFSAAMFLMISSLFLLAKKRKGGLAKENLKKFNLQTDRH